MRGAVPYARAQLQARAHPGRLHERLQRASVRRGLGESPKSPVGQGIALI
jgi:hypothetical protein